MANNFFKKAQQAREDKAKENQAKLEADAKPADHQVTMTNDVLSKTEQATSTVTATGVSTAKLFGKQKVKQKPAVPSSSSAPSGENAKAALNNVLEGLELPEPPDRDASPEELLAYQLERLQATIEHPIAARDSLATLHDQLKSRPELRDLLMPEHIGNITKTMAMLTQTAHGRAVKKKGAAQKRATKKAKVAEEVDAMADVFGGLM